MMGGNQSTPNRAYHASKQLGANAQFSKEQVQQLLQLLNQNKIENPSCVVA